MAVKLTDDLGRELMFTREPRRIVSLVPSDTYTLFALGAGERLVGRTRFCTEPGEALAGVPEVGGTKDADPERVADLVPDLVLANQEENARGPIEEMARRGLPVLVSFPRRVAEGIAHMARLARLLGLAGQPAAQGAIRAAYRALCSDAEVARAEPTMPRAFVPIWRDPLMTFNHDTFAADVLLQIGCVSAFAGRERQYPLAADLGRRSPIAADRLGLRDRRYPRVPPEEVVARAPDLMLLPDEPHRFSQADAEELAALDTPAGRAGRIALVSGKDLFWYGARAAEALPRLREVVSGLK